MRSPVTHTSLSAVTAAANGSSNLMNGVSPIVVTLHWTYTGANPPTAVDVRLEGRNGSDDFTQVGAAITELPTVSGGEYLTYPFAAGYWGEIRLRLVTLTGGTAPTLTGTITEGS